MYMYSAAAEFEKDIHTDVPVLFSRNLEPAKLNQSEREEEKTSGNLNINGSNF